MTQDARFKQLWVLCLFFIVYVNSASLAIEPASPSAFDTTVRPLLKAHCFQCHGEESSPKAKLDLRLVKAMRKGGESGPAIVPGHRDESLLWEKIEAGEMPPGSKKLSTEEKAKIGAWIDAGAASNPNEPESMPPGPVLTDAERSFWAFQPVKRTAPPAIKNKAVVSNPIDQFLLARLEAKGVSFSPIADRATFIRRASFDLVGLPPTPEEVVGFVNDKDPDAYDRLVDRLLDSPQYGERWARHWLDVAGYADSDGDATTDAVRPHAYRYRDYLIRGLNLDRPWDVMIHEQLAGDELVGSSLDNLDPADHDRLAATGFLRMVPDSTAEGGVDAVQARNDVVAETMKVVSSSLLGLTVGCAQCHAHRYDPITQEDYYRLRAVFEPAFDVANWRVPSARLVSLWSPDDRRRSEEVDTAIKRHVDERGRQIETLVKEVHEKELAQVPESERSKVREAHDTPPAKRSDAQKALLKTYPRVLVTAGNVSLYGRTRHASIMKEFDQKIEATKKRRPAESFAHALTERPGALPKTFLFKRGDPKQPGAEMQPAELGVLITTAGPFASPTVPTAKSTSGRRLAYAKHLTSGKHPLVARVLVNRMWHHHFGRGIVGTSADFGMLGERPSHPELLDWLADEFIKNGWRMKRIHRLIMTSNAYRQSAKRLPELDAIDPENRLLGRMNVRRLEAEAVRDSMLAVSGKLNLTMFGPPLPVAPDEAGQILIGKDTRDTAGRQTGAPGSLGEVEFRRSLYIQVRRSMPLSFTESFDPPTLDPNCDRRSSSTIAPQSLALMNNDFAQARSTDFATRVIKTAGADGSARVKTAWKLAFGVEPDAKQVATATQFLTEEREAFAAKIASDKAKGQDADVQALSAFCQALMCSNAFLYVD